MSAGLLAPLRRIGALAVGLTCLPVAVYPAMAADIAHGPKARAGKAAQTSKAEGKRHADPVRPPLVLDLGDPAPELVPSADAARVIAWVAAAHDNGKLPYAVVDKQAAALFLFDADGNMLGQTPVLLGVGIGDDSSPGVGAKTLEDIGPAERTTPAGRFVAKFGLAVGHQRVLWVDYADSVAMHAVITTHKAEHRVERLATPTPDDNRITFGCINVGTDFYDTQVRPLFRGPGGIVYILPDTKTLEDVFPRVRMLPYLRGASMARP